ncbi:MULTISPECIES: NAD kinase [Glutamicibacter]|uniref:NAD kinase n=1 Tax=Glutamicibacter halophytocola TaxID=1933880 RepID=A0A5B8IR95_9MICC|nr:MULTISPECIES: NAD kinase [Glutamicibacter]ALG28606.1 inorganic polyphosphate kinase [Glutamicibacter halophytocola]MBF6672129.1 NAD kinase [Glutamicibacter sp. FBE19]NQD41226.1 NAD kinase [Glutamicibacter halophytocola]QDY67903.1 NAD kinase [Glutamicibacter halophytocola]UUX60084.1 NAD kinase [Glutamicibacter halophytocola]
MRRILVFTHTGRQEAIAAAIETCSLLKAAGAITVMRRKDHEAMTDAIGEAIESIEILGEDCQIDDVDLGVVLGGDGSVLRAAELVREAPLPLVGVNLGHVGFLAEAERSELAATVDALVNQEYTVEERMTIEVKVWLDNVCLAETWALNEAAVEKANRERMVEVVIEVDGRPISTFGCDGVVMATPTGSTAYSFSAGGPVVWPDVAALIMVPISAHALFAKPLVVSPDSVMAVEILTRTDAGAVLWCDGRRTIELPPGARVEVTRSSRPVYLARLNTTPFSERLVNKFELPITGWRGPAKVDARRSATAALPVIGPGLQSVEPHHRDEPGIPMVARTDDGPE